MIMRQLGILKFRVFLQDNNLILDESEGSFYRPNNKRAGSFDKDGYRIIKINKSSIKEHHLVWWYYNGYKPDYIHHINGVRDDNRIENLLEVSHKYNMQHQKVYSNNNTGYCGVGFVKKSGKYRVRFGQKQVGTFNTIEEAVDYRIKYKLLLENMSYLEV